MIARIIFLIIWWTRFRAMIRQIFSKDINESTLMTWCDHQAAELTGHDPWRWWKHFDWLLTGKRNGDK